jgi:hypothetical protein
MNKFRELPVKEYDIVSQMMNAASEHGLEVEVVSEFVNILRNDMDIDLAEAAAMALMEWNI